MGEEQQVVKPRRRIGCGVEGCLTLAVILFALLLIAMLAIALLRPWPTPPVGTRFAMFATPPHISFPAGFPGR